MAPEFVQECSDICVVKNSTAQLEVIASGSQPLQIRWFKDEEPIKYGKRLKMSSDGEHCTLKISPVQILDQGIYKCVISNKAGTQSCEAKITVEGELANNIKGIVRDVACGNRSRNGCTSKPRVNLCILSPVLLY